MTYTKIEIWNALSELQATQISVEEKDKEIRKIMKKIYGDIK